MTKQGKKGGVKSQLHPRNLHQGRYDLAALVKCCPSLEACLTVNPRGEQSVDFSSDTAVRLLNQALLAHFYNVTHWAIPDGYLCPPIPGRADYVHYAADLLESGAKNARVLDVGTGANCIYPIIGVRTYAWRVVASDIDPVSVASAAVIAQTNPALKGKIEPRLQPDSRVYFKHVIKPGEYYDLTMCNPPFHASQAQADEATSRKQRNLKTAGHASQAVAGRNFGGQNNELWCAGGEIAFLKAMCRESVAFAAQVRWFTTLVSKRENIVQLRQLLTKLKAQDVKVVEMRQGQKVSRMLAWRFQ